LLAILFKLKTINCVQVTGDINAVKNAFLVISSRLRESQHRDRSGDRGGHFHGRGHSPERFFPPDDDYIPHVTSGSRRSSVERGGFGSRVATNNSRNNNHASLAYAMDQGAAPVAEDGQLFYEDLVFRVLCPVDRVDRIVGESDGIMDILLNTVGVNVKVADPVGGSDEQIVIITSAEVLSFSCSLCHCL
jgi:poly(rC)-binding protein 2/3/4